MRLTLRDKLIIETVREQDFCFYKDICKNFFPSKSSASQSLKRLVDSGHIILEPVERFEGDTLDDLSVRLFAKNHLIVRLGDECKLIKRKASFWKRRHQLLLFSVKERLEKILGMEAVFENQIRDLKETLHNGDFEPLPDFYLKGKDYKLAVELEMSLKSQGRYFLKLSEYKNSRFTHVLYVATHIKSLQRLLRTFRYRNYIGIAHFSEVETVFSHRYGKQSLTCWIKERTK